MGIQGYTTNYNLTKYKIGSSDWGAGMNNNLDVIDTQIKTVADNISTAQGLITGEVRQVAFETVPSGWLECNGAAVSRTTYASLFSAIGTAFGEGDGSTTFNLPDLRGRFVRGYDHGAGNDPDAATRTASASGGDTGDAVGSKQGYAFQEHSHHLTSSAGGTGDYAVYVGLGASLSNDIDGIEQAVEWNGNGTPATASETRPANVALMYIIKT
jgi:microcystin-dependent protein